MHVPEPRVVVPVRVRWMSTDREPSTAAADESEQVFAQLLQRQPETHIEPSLTRITDLMAALGDPHSAYPVIQVTGTNGKSSTARMIASLLRALGLRTGLYTSPHLSSPTERIEIDGEPISPESFIATWHDVEPFVQIVDDRSLAEDGLPLSFFEVMTALAYAAFADAPVDVAVVEVGMGGSWDATSVASAQVSVITPIDLDHMDYLGPTIRDIATEKAGIIAPNGVAVIAAQSPEAASVLSERLTDVKATGYWENQQFSIVHRDVAVGGLVVTIDGLGGVYSEIFVPLFGEHQAHNAACALVAVEAFLGANVLAAEVVEEGFTTVTVPGRLEIVRTGPTVVLDVAHNPAGARALAAALAESFAFTHVVGVMSVMSDKDALGMLIALEPVFDEVVITANLSRRAMPVDDLAAMAVEIFGAERVEIAASFADAMDSAVRLAEEADTYAASGVVVTGSVVTVGQARSLFNPSRSGARMAAIRPSDPGFGDHLGARFGEEQEE